MSKVSSLLLLVEWVPPVICYGPLPIQILGVKLSSTLRCAKLLTDGKLLSWMRTMASSLLQGTTSLSRQSTPFIRLRQCRLMSLAPPLSKETFRGLLLLA